MVALIFIILGVTMVVVSTFAVIRFPDFYTRLNAVGILDSSGVVLLLIGFALQNKFSVSTIKVVLLIVLILVSNSTNSYVLARTYYRIRGNNKNG